MKIVSLEPTPSPNTMKLTLSESLPQGKANNYTLNNKDEAPSFIREIFNIKGVKGVYHVADFIAVERTPKVDWKVILPEVRKVFGEEAEKSSQVQVDEHFGEVNVQIQEFKDIPMQIKVSDGETEERVGLPERFIEAVAKATKEDDNVVLLRKWREQSPRYGDLKEVADEVAEEIQATYSERRLKELVETATNSNDSLTLEKPKREWLKVTEDMLDEEDWKKRFALLEQMNPDIEDLPVLEKALQDEKPSIRRLATVYLGMIEDEAVIPYLEKALLDKTVTVRRTAGDAMSDIGSKAGIPAMIKALDDSSKLVRWRAAMFLYEIGDESAIPALKETENDPEFEVSMQAKLALARIEGGEEAKGSVWKQMTDAFEK
ncbi:conserved virulence factor C family protein [Salipaludibacillus sp. CUR1]|uniref:conserved virulence factor C family protein n=1 Tax=Salipaludibacillus sp. CUR1 TaxID=2820003 RepID=UPI001E4E1D2A|nr:conserved virulence factor C family protein [Salipaludibacillus sp. CUR1]MCE7792118.1 conserved virulence factor C family protein [Salipaludibacillus sp. CUR1]